jgi:hypothetical protein
MLTAIFIFLGGMLVRADGWGPENDEAATTWPKWQIKLANFFSAWTSGACFALLTLVYTGDGFAAIAAGLAYVMWRAPGFHGWENWGAMFWRGWWTSAIGFTGLSLVVHMHPYFGALSIAMGVSEMVSYSGAYRFLPGRVPAWVVHAAAEITSGLAFSALVIQIL